MTPDELRAAIARDCPHRLDDYDRHAALFEARRWSFGSAVLAYWQREHAISSRPDIEERIDSLYRQAQDCDDYAIAKSYLDQAARIRHEIAEGLK